MAVSKIQVKIDSTVLMTGMQKGVEWYCKNLKTIVEEQAKTRTLTAGDFLVLIESSKDVFVEMCEKSIEDKRESKTLINADKIKSKLIPNYQQ